jgi:hypothetical protein
MTGSYNGKLYNMCESVYRFTYIHIYMGYAVAQLVEALRYKSEGHGFVSRWCH